MLDIQSWTFFTHTVTAAFIDDEPTYPQVVVTPASVSLEKLSLNRATKEYTCQVIIEIYTKKNKQIDQITDEICADLNTNEATLAAFGLYIGNIEDSNEDTVFWNDDKIHTKMIVIDCKVNV